MSMVRCVVFVSPATIRQYDALATRAVESRSFLMRYVLERAIHEAEQYVDAAPRSAALPAAGPAHHDSAARRRGRPSRQTRAKQLADLENLVRRLHEESPGLDIDGVRRVVLLNVKALSAQAVPSDLLEQALVRVFSQRSDEAPEPVDDNRPPE